MTAIRFLVTLLLLIPSTLYGQIQWERTNGPSQGHIRDIYVLTTGSNGIILAAGPQLTYRSTDAGVTWNQVGPGASSFFLSSGTVFGNAAEGGGIYRSTDLGETWAPGGSGLIAGSISGYAKNAIGSLFASTNTGMFRSTDGGEVWTQINNGLTSTDIQVLTITTSGYLCAGTSDNGIFRSTDDGDSWSQVALSGNMVRALDSHLDEVYAAPFYGSGIAYSTNGGATWNETGDLENMGHTVLLRGENGNLYVGGDPGGLQRSTNNGTTWQQITNVVSSQFVDLTEFPGVIFGGTWGGGVSKSTDFGTSWTESNGNLVNAEVMSLSAFSNGWIIAGAAGSGIHRSTDRGDSWSHVSSRYTDVPDFYMKNDTAFAVIWTPGFGQGGVLRSTDNGANWASSGLVAESLWSVHGTVSGTLLAGTDSRGVYRSTNMGVGWTLSNTGIESRRAYSMTGDGPVFVGTEDGVYKSTDGGVTWLPTGSELNGKEVRSVLVLKTGTILAGTILDGSFRSTDGGATWVVSNGGLGLPHLFSYAEDSAGSVYVSTFVDGIFRSTSDGQSWFAESEGLTNFQMPSLLVAPDSTIYAGSAGSGVFRTSDEMTPPLPSGSSINVRAIRIDAGGNFWVRTAKDSSGQRTDQQIVKFSPSLSRIDSVSLPPSNDQGFESMIHDPSGNLWVEVSISVGDTSSYFKLYKVAPAGNPILDSVSYQSSFQLFETSSGLVSDSAGNIWGAGIIISQFDDGFGPLTEGSLALWKFTNSAQLVPGYPKLFERGSGLDGAIGNVATGIDTAGNVFAAALSRNGSGTYDFALWKFDSNGAVVNGFPKVLPGFHTELNYVEMALKVKGQAVWVAGSKFTGSKYDFYILKFDLSGSVVVTKTWSTLSGIDARGGRDIEVTSGGDVIALGDTSSSEQNSARVVWRYTSSGNLVSGYPKLFDGNVMALDVSGTLWTDETESGIPKVSVLGPTVAGVEGTITSVEFNASPPINFSLSQNYPNPFNPSTSIRFEVPVAAHVSAEIYDVLGRLISVAVNETKQPGSYLFVWDARNQPSGVYFLRFRSEQYGTTRKLVLMK